MPSKDKLRGEWSTENGEAAFPWHTRWAGCTYELAEHHVPGLDPFLVLRPISNSKSEVRWFDPVEEEPSSVLPRSPEDQRTTPHEALAHLDLGNPDEILRFVNRWGLLGLWEVPEYANWEPFLFWVVSEKLARELTTQQEPGIFSEAWYERERRRERWFGRAGWLNRQEPLPAFQVAAWHYQEWVSRIERFGALNTVTDRQDAEDEITWGFEVGDCPYTDFVDNVTHYAPGFSLLTGGVQPRLVWDEGRGRWVFGWQYRSLLHAIYFATFLTMVQGDASGGFRRCANDRCGRFFIATRRNARFCSKLCEKAQTMRNHRAKQSKERETHAGQGAQEARS